MSDSQMIINYVPGEECRVAILQDGKLEETHVERFANASRVGNIYVGRVTNVEPAIQAAFVDFGVEDNGFLHVSDLHPRYFPGEDDDTTERVGLKTPRRERPPIQACLRRGDEVIVQVLKEGVGTKGPTLTSYLSIPGRFLVMMPYMDRTGVSRKVEDEDQRRKMREILDQLELPEGFGFIVRTAGMERNKTELKRDLAYLQRLWKDMEKRLGTGNKPRLLYSESDLLVRALRDLLSTDIKEVVVDNELALQRAARFMKIVAPRGQAKLLHHTGTTPLFHAFGIEQQIGLIHAREVPLPSGGRLVIDQTEALVAIDVNSGKSRESRDSESNAYQTNIEAVEEICRQLRLRDLGGIVINDLIDMRSAQHRKDIEHRFRERLKRDRAKTTVLAISEFGILQMTRQRMRASHESVHFVDCPTCRGRGVVQRPDSIAADALRELAAILDVDRVAKVEMVVAPRVAGELLSTKRRLLGRIERGTGKHVDVRVSETVMIDRVGFYAYDAGGADIDVSSLPKPRRPRDLKEFEYAAAGENWAQDLEEEKALAAEPADEPETEETIHPIEIDDAGDGTDEPTDESGGRKRRRRRRGRGRGRGDDRDAPRQDGRSSAAPAREPSNSKPSVSTPNRSQTSSNGMMQFAGDHGDEHESGPVESGSPQDAGETTPTTSDGENREGGRRRRRRRRGRGRGQGQGTDMGGDAPVCAESRSETEPQEEREDHAGDGASPERQAGESQGEGEGGERRGRRRRRRRGGRGGSGEGSSSGGEGTNRDRPAQQTPRAESSKSAPTPEVKPTAKPRTLYSSRRKLAASELNKRPKPE